MRRLMIAGNWKMNAASDTTAAWLDAVVAVNAPERDLVVCPPFPYLGQVVAGLEQSQLQVGAQNCASEEAGAYTGEVSVAMLADVGCQYVIIGHSERRALYAESNELVLAKTRRVLTAGLKAIVCVGETLSERQAGNAEQVVGQQLSLLLSELSTTEWQAVVIAYEPVWAIGTGETATPEQAQAVHQFIRSQLAARDVGLAEATQILYGGSVKADNARELFSQPDIDGGLVGGASLEADQFLKICTA